MRSATCLLAISRALGAGNSDLPPPEGEVLGNAETLKNADRRVASNLTSPVTKDIPYPRQ